MRPQHITAENADGEPDRPAAMRASMRPQHITAENVDVFWRWVSQNIRFNEAAAYHCGKPATPAITRLLGDHQLQ